MQLRLDGSRTNPFRRVVRDAQGRETGKVYLFQPREPLEVDHEDLHILQRDLGHALWIVKQINHRGKIEVDKEATLGAAQLPKAELAEAARAYDAANTLALKAMLPIEAIPSADTAETAVAPTTDEAAADDANPPPADEPSADAATSTATVPTDSRQRRRR